MHATASIAPVLAECVTCPGRAMHKPQHLSAFGPALHAEGQEQDGSSVQVRRLHNAVARQKDQTVGFGASASQCRMPSVQLSCHCSVGTGVCMQRQRPGLGPAVQHDICVTPGTFSVPSAHATGDLQLIAMPLRLSNHTMPHVVSLQTPLGSTLRQFSTIMRPMLNSTGTPIRGLSPLGLQPRMPNHFQVRPCSHAGLSSSSSQHPPLMASTNGSKQLEDRHLNLYSGFNRPGNSLVDVALAPGPHSGSGVPCASARCQP